MTSTTSEQSIRETLPEGFQTTFMEAERLRRLQNVQVNNLGETVDEYQNRTLTENEVIVNHADRVLTSFLLPERTIEYPGLALTLDPPTEGPNGVTLLERWASLYKRDNDTPSGTIKDPVRASTDDIVFSFCTPEVWNEIAGTSKYDYTQSGLTAGTLDLIGDSGIDGSANTNGNSLQLDADEYLFFTGDVIDLADGQSVLTGATLTDVDGEDFGPVNNQVLAQRHSGAHIATYQGTYATTTLDFDMKIYEGGDAEPVPLCFYLGPGQKAPSLRSP